MLENEGAEESPGLPESIRPWGEMAAAQKNRPPQISASRPRFGLGRAYNRPQSRRFSWIMISAANGQKIAWM